MTKDGALGGILIAELKCTVQAADRFQGIEIVRNQAAGTLSAHQQLYIPFMVATYACDGTHQALLPISPSLYFAAGSLDMGELLASGYLRRNLAV